MVNLYGFGFWVLGQIWGIDFPPDFIDYSGIDVKNASRDGSYKRGWETDLPPGGTGGFGIRTPGASLSKV